MFLSKHKPVPSCHWPGGEQLPLILHDLSHLLLEPTFSLLVNILPRSESALVLHQDPQLLGFLGGLFKRDQSKPHLAPPLDSLGLPGAGTGQE